ncbi:uncharacterized protein N7459_008747 [Penicillium hispanicum]|uniref:uncharacterized protein n=1 Tax=Penicillium hispanicum TaxID=1080232 RepID=UPI002540E07D|nr:uncharacterized protein N7459_008747 [Penicillium hispanicum]KAJ5574320.1 hypothetical protein N7459_008747 [Penicillium hispanicum]
MPGRCDDPSCSCQEPKPVPIEPLNLLLSDTESGEIRPLHDEDTELDVIFDILSGTMTIKQSVHDPKPWPAIKHKTTIHFTQSNSAFVNLEGLADNSLLFTFKPNSTPTDNMESKTTTRGFADPRRTKLKVRTQDSGFLLQEPKVGPLFKHVMDLSGPNKVLQLRLPENRIRDWATVALILLTYREINSTVWDGIVRSKVLQDVAGLNWARIKERTTTPLMTRLSLTQSRQNEVARKETITAQASRLGLDLDVLKRGFPGISAAFTPQDDPELINSGNLGSRGN